MTIDEALKLIPGGLPGIPLKTVRCLSADHLRTTARGWKFGLCTWCLKPIPDFPKKPFWCSSICNDRLKSYQVDRTQIWLRDQGICAKCGIDTEAIGKELTDLGSYTDELTENKPLTLGSYKQTHIRQAEIPPEILEQADLWIKGSCEEIDVKAMQVANWAKENGVTWMLKRYGKHLWEVDHKIPVSKGGGILGVENLITLCLKCHWKKSGSDRK